MEYFFTKMLVHTYLVKNKDKGNSFHAKKAFSFKHCKMKVYHQILSEEMFPFSKTYLMKNSALKTGSKRTNP